MNEFVLKVNVRSEFVFGDDMLEITVNFGAGCVEGRPVGLRTKELRFISKLKRAQSVPLVRMSTGTVEGCINNLTKAQV